MKINLEVGKTYVARDGRKVKIISRKGNNNKLPFIGEIVGGGASSWSPSGYFFTSMVDSSLDLIKEYAEMTKTTEQLIADHEATLKALKARLEEEKKAEDNIWGIRTIPNKLGAKYYYITGTREAGFKIEHCEMLNPHNESKVPVFNTKESAEAFAEAIKVMLELRLQPGRTRCVPGAKSWVLMRNVAKGYPDVEFTYSANTFAGAFKSESAALSAISAVGAERIKKAINTLAGI